MERLTKWENGRAHYPRCFEEPCGGMGCRIKDCSLDVAICERLAAYEDTGLTPEQCVNAKTIVESAFSDDTSKAERIRELLKADKDGRVVVLPCKVGDTVYWVHGTVITECRVHRIHVNRNGLYICLKSTMSHGAFRVDLCLGKNVFLTREEAEKVLGA